MGINLGAAMSPLLCGYIGETYGWHYGFGLATIGMLTGIAVFVAPVRVTQMLIALRRGGGGARAVLCFAPTTRSRWRSTCCVAMALLVAAAVSRASRSSAAGCPTAAGAPRDPSEAAHGALRSDR